MSRSWPERHVQLLSILDIAQDDDEDDRLGLALDEGTHVSSQVAINTSCLQILSGKAKKQVAQLRFSDRDLRVIGALDAGQYSTVPLSNPLKKVRFGTERAID
jgi:hypothetical protein